MRAKEGDPKCLQDVKNQSAALVGVLLFWAAGGEGGGAQGASLELGMANPVGDALRREKGGLWDFHPPQGVTHRHATGQGGGRMQLPIPSLYAPKQEGGGRGI